MHWALPKIPAPSHSTDWWEFQSWMEIPAIPGSITSNKQPTTVTTAVNWAWLTSKWHELSAIAFAEESNLFASGAKKKDDWGMGFNDYLTTGPNNQPHPNLQGLYDATTDCFVAPLEPRMIPRFLRFDPPLMRLNPFNDSSSTMFLDAGFPMLNKLIKNFYKKQCSRIINPRGKNNIWNPPFDDQWWNLWWTLWWNPIDP